MYTVIALFALAFFSMNSNMTNQNSPIDDWPFQQHETFTTDGTPVIWYLSEPTGINPDPIVVWIQGSGYGSHFQKINGQVKLVSGARAVLAATKGRARLLLVEKAATSPLDAPKHPGTAIDSPEAFREQHTLDTWTEMVKTAIQAALDQEGITPDPLLIAGHSEGGIVAASVAAAMPEVTHVAILAGGGPTQLYDLLCLARKGELGDPNWSPDEAESWLIESWDDITSDPMSVDKMFLGHPYRRWTSFLRTSVIELLDKTDASVLIVQGTADLSVEPSSADVLYTELLADCHPVERFLVDHADHNFILRDNSPEEQSRSMWRDVVRSAVDFALHK